MTTATEAAPITSITLPPLADGETYVGLILKEDGTPSHHLVLLPGDADDANWKTQIAWAKKQGGELPTRREQALLFANCKQHFKADWYWSGEEYASGSDYAWNQNFIDGYQDFSDRYDVLRARAVRRLFIQ